ncbi:hypothetical protein HpCHN32_05450 [Helicobacter pylori]|nr:hypothetical protein KVL92_01875 [Helicobacter pylori]
MPDIRNLYLSLPNLTERLYKISRRLYIMLSSYSFLAREHRILERMHELKSLNSFVCDSKAIYPTTPFLLWVV